MTRGSQPHLPMAVAVLISSAQPLAVVGLGWLLLRTRLFSTADGEVGDRAVVLKYLFERFAAPVAHSTCMLDANSQPLQTAAKFAVWFTLPSLILQSFNG